MIRPQEQQTVIFKCEPELIEELDKLVPKYAPKNIEERKASRSKVIRIAIQEKIERENKK